MDKSLLERRFGVSEGRIAYVCINHEWVYVRNNSLTTTINSHWTGDYSEEWETYTFDASNGTTEVTQTGLLAEITGVQYL